jgi:hypothetical protein
VTAIVTVVTPSGHETPVIVGVPGNTGPVHEAPHAVGCDISNMTG